MASIASLLNHVQFRRIWFLWEREKMVRGGCSPSRYNRANWFISNQYVQWRGPTGNYRVRRIQRLQQFGVLLPATPTVGWVHVSSLGVELIYGPSMYHEVSGWKSFLVWKHGLMGLSSGNISTIQFSQDLLKINKNCVASYVSCYVLYITFNSFNILAYLVSLQVFLFIFPSFCTVDGNVSLVSNFIFQD